MSSTDLTAQPTTLNIISFVNAIDHHDLRSGDRQKMTTWPGVSVVMGSSSTVLREVSGQGFASCGTGVG